MHDLFLHFPANLSVTRSARELNSQDYFRQSLQNLMCSPKVFKNTKDNFLQHSQLNATLTAVKLSI